MIERIGEGAWLAKGERDGARVCIAFGTHGNERAPIDAGKQLVSLLENGDLAVGAGTLLLVYSNPRAGEVDQRWSEGGIDLNRCFHADTLAKEPELYEHGRAREIAGWLTEHAPTVLVDFHCTVEPGERFLMHHPPIEDAAHRQVVGLLEASVLLADPDLRFGGVSLDEWMSTRGRVGICYETGWIGDPNNTPEAVLREMKNVLAGHGMLAGVTANRYEDKRRIQLYSVILCEGDGFRWDDGVGENLQELPAGARLGAYADGTAVKLEAESTLIFPKKKPELVETGKPLVLLARRIDSA